MISRRLMIAALGLGLTAFAPQIAHAEQYLEDAIAETREAIAAGKQGEPGSFAEHVTQAIDRARSAVWINPVDPIRKGIKTLRKAYKIARGTSSDRRLDKATALAESALAQFEAVK